MKFKVTYEFEKDCDTETAVELTSRILKGENYDEKVNVTSVAFGKTEDDFLQMERIENVKKDL